PDKHAAATVVDVGTGSGAIICSLLHEYQNFQGIAVDISPIALSIAADNASRLGVGGRLKLVASNLLEKVEGEVSIIVSNPPYITTAEMAVLMPDVQHFEPELALHAGPDGLDIYRSLIPQAYAKLHAGGLLALEIGYQQQAAVKALLEPTQWQDINCYQDLAGHDRVIVAIRR
ncbi:MAG: HemK/PrmC family methyltransferase, partial [Alphaproteobacteria bacterium]